MARNRRGSAAVPSPHTVRLAAEVFRLRAEGLSYRQIAREMGCSPSTAFEAAEAGARLILRSVGAEEQVATMVARLDAGVHSIWAGYVAGDAAAHLSMDRLERRRARLLGLDAPTTLRVAAEVAVTAEDPSERTRRLIAEVEAYSRGLHDLRKEDEG